VTIFDLHILQAVALKVKASSKLDFWQPGFDKNPETSDKAPSDIIRLNALVGSD
jgi:hypothetical protein